MEERRAHLSTGSSIDGCMAEYSVMAIGGTGVGTGVDSSLITIEIASPTRVRRSSFSDPEEAVLAASSVGRSSNDANGAGPNLRCFDG